MSGALIFRLGLVALFFLCPSLSWGAKRTDAPLPEVATPSSPSLPLSSTLHLGKFDLSKKSAAPLTLDTYPKVELTSPPSFAFTAPPCSFSSVDRPPLPMFFFPYFTLSPSTELDPVLSSRLVSKQPLSSSPLPSFPLPLRTSFSHVSVTPPSSQPSTTVHLPLTESYPTLVTALPLSDVFAAPPPSFRPLSFDLTCVLASHSTRCPPHHIPQAPLRPCLLPPPVAPLHIPFGSSKQASCSPPPQKEALSFFFPQELFSYFYAFTPPPYPFTFPQKRLLKMACLKRSFPKPSLNFPSLASHFSPSSLCVISSPPPPFFTFAPQLILSFLTLPSSYPSFTARPDSTSFYTLLTHLNTAPIGCYSSSQPLCRRPDLSPPPSFTPDFSMSSRDFLTVRAFNVPDIHFPSTTSLSLSLLPIGATHVGLHNVSSSTHLSFSLAPPDLLWPQLPLPKTPSCHFAPPLSPSAFSVSSLALTLPPPLLAYDAPRVEQGALPLLAARPVAPSSLSLKALFHAYLSRSIPRPVRYQMHIERLHLPLAASNLTAPYAPSHLCQHTFATVGPTHHPRREATDLMPFALFTPLKWTPSSTTSRWHHLATTAPQKGFALTAHLPFPKKYPLASSPSHVALPQHVFAHTHLVASASLLPSTPQAEKGFLPRFSLQVASPFSLPSKPLFYSCFSRSVPTSISSQMKMQRAHLTPPAVHLTSPYATSNLQHHVLVALNPKLKDPCCETTALAPFAPFALLTWTPSSTSYDSTLATPPSPTILSLTEPLTPLKKAPIAFPPSDLALPLLFLASTPPISTPALLPLFSPHAVPTCFSPTLSYPLRSSWLLSLGRLSTPLTPLTLSLATLSTSSFLDHHFSFPSFGQDAFLVDTPQHGYQDLVALDQHATFLFHPTGFACPGLADTMSVDLSSAVAPIAPSGSRSTAFIHAQHTAYMAAAPQHTAHSPFSQKQRNASAHLTTKRFRQPSAYLASLPLPGDLNTFSLNNAFETTLRYTQCTHQKGYLFALDIKPNKALSFPAPSHNFIFVLDASGTVKSRRFQAFKEGISTALHYLKADDSFNILVVDSHAVAFRPRPVSWSKKSAYTARRFLKETTYRGFYAKDDAFSLLQLASRYFVDDKKNIVLLMTDGHLLGTLKQHTTDFAQLAHYTQDFSLFATAASHHNNLAMLDLISTVTGGELMYSATHAAFPRKLAVLVKNLGQSIASTVRVQAASPLSTEVTFYPDQNTYPILYGNQTYTIYGVVDHPQDFDLILQGKGTQCWINAKQRVSFRHVQKGGVRLERDFAQQLAYLCYRDYLKREDPFFLAEAEKLLQPHSIPCAAR